MGVSSDAGEAAYTLPGGGVSTLSPIDPFDDLQDVQIEIPMEQVESLAVELQEQSQQPIVAGNTEPTQRIEAPDTPGGSVNYVAIPDASQPAATTLTPDQLQPSIPSYYPEPYYIPPQIVIEQLVQVIYEPEVIYYPVFEPVFIERRRCVDFGIEIAIWDLDHDRDHRHDHDGDHHDPHGGTHTPPPAHPPVITSNPPPVSHPPLAGVGSIPAGANHLGGLPIMAFSKQTPTARSLAVTTGTSIPVTKPVSVPASLRVTRYTTTNQPGVVKATAKPPAPIVTSVEPATVTPGARVVTNSKLPVFAPPPSPAAKVIVDRTPEVSVPVPAARVPAIVRTAPTVKPVVPPTASPSSKTSNVVVTPASPAPKSDEKPEVKTNSKLPVFTPAKPAPVSHDAVITTPAKAEPKVIDVPSHAPVTHDTPAPPPVVIHDVPAPHVVHDAPAPAPIVIHDAPVIHEAPAFHDAPVVHDIPTPHISAPPPSPPAAQPDTHSGNAPDKLPTFGGKGR
jgi:hypothetical protein